MKKILLTILVFSFALFAEYQVWDIVDNIQWQDSDGGDPVARDLYSMIDEGKVVFLTWGYKG